MTSQQFISLVKSTQGAYRSFLLALCCGDRALADDIAQEAYIKAYLAADSLGQADKFGPWLRRIAYTTFLNHARARQPFAPAGEAADIPAGDQADDAFKYESLYAALGRLPEAERMAVLLYYIDGYSIKEIAQVIGASEAAVKQQLSRGRLRLRNLIPSL